MPHEPRAAGRLAALTQADVFQHYAGAAVGDAQDRTEVFAFIESLVRRHASPEAAERLLEELQRHVDGWSGHYFNGINPIRPGYSGAYHDRLKAALAPTRHVGAVHLELGTWTAFDDERTARLRAEDGLAELVRLDFERAYRPDVAADVTALPFRDASMDRVASNSLFEHVAYPHRIIAESFRVLRPGGVMVVAMPFVFNLHGYPDDYVRLTPSFFERVCREQGFEHVVADVEPASGLYYTLHNSAKSAVVAEDAPERAAAQALHVATMLMLGSLIPLDERFENGGRQWFHSVLCFAVKPGVYAPSGRPAGDPDVPFVERCLDLLADPVAHTRLVRRGDELVSWRTLRRYPVSDGIPDFSDPSALRRRSPRRFLAWRLELSRRRVRALRRRGG